MSTFEYGKINLGEGYRNAANYFSSYIHASQSSTYVLFQYVQTYTEVHLSRHGITVATPGEKTKEGRSLVGYEDASVGYSYPQKTNKTSSYSYRTFRHDRVKVQK